MKVHKWFLFGLISLPVMGCTVGNAVCKARFNGRRWGCPNPWIEWGGNCYRAVMERLQWSKAKEKCTKMGGSLAVPRSQKEVDFLLRLLPRRFWINCSDFDEEGIWRCQDRTDEVGFRNWAPYEPNNFNNENCAMSYPGGKWNDLRCGSQLSAICKAATSHRGNCTW